MSKKVKEINVVQKARQGYKILPVQLLESIKTLTRLATFVSEGIVKIPGVNYQVSYHGKLVRLLEDEMYDISRMKPSDCPYSAGDLQRIEELLINLQEIIIRLLPIGKTDYGTLLKEIRVLLSIGYEKQKLLESMLGLINFLHDIPVFKRKYGGQLQQEQFLDRTRIKGCMKNDEGGFKDLLKNKLEQLKQMDRDFIADVNQMIKFFDTATAAGLYGVYDALDIEEVTDFDKIIRQKILSEEAKINKKNLRFDNDILGEGTFGNVHGATLIASNGKRRWRVATKTPTTDEELLKDEFVELSNEISRWRYMNSPYLVACHGMSLRSKQFHIVFEKMELSLYEYLHVQTKTLTIKEQEKVMIDVAIALLQLHVFGVIHRNLAPKNVLIGKQGILGGPLKLTDFGIGMYKYAMHSAGPTVYTPPEVLMAENNNYNQHGWTTKGDVYALGLMFWEITQEDEIPFKKHKYELRKYVGIEKHIPRTDIVPKFPAWKKKLIRDCLDYDPALRPNAKNVCDLITLNAKAVKEEANMGLKEVELAKAQASQLDVAARPTNSASNAKRASVTVIGDTVRMIDPVTGAFDSHRVVGTRRRVGEENLIAVSDGTGAPRPPRGPRPPSSPNDSSMMKSKKKKKKGKELPKVELYNEDNVAYDSDEVSIDDGYDSDSSFEKGQAEKLRTFSWTSADDKKARKMQRIRDRGGHGDEADADGGPDANEIRKARKAQKLVDLARSQVSNQKKLVPRVRDLTEEIMNTDKLELNRMGINILLSKSLGDVDCEMLWMVAKWNKRLLRVVIEYSKITNEGVNLLARGVGNHPTLLQLILGDNKGITQVNELAERIAHNDILELLALDNCKIGDDGAKYLGKMLVTCGLLELDLSNNRIGNEGVAALAKGVTKARELSKRDDEDAEPELKSLVISGQKESCGSGLRKLRKAIKGTKIKINRRLIH